MWGFWFFHAETVTYIYHALTNFTLHYFVFMTKIFFFQRSQQQQQQQQPIGLDASKLNDNTAGLNRLHAAALTTTLDWIL